MLVISANAFIPALAINRPFSAHLRTAETARMPISRRRDDWLLLRVERSMPIEAMRLKYGNAIIDNAICSAIDKTN